MMEIVPGILVHDEQDFHEHLFHPGLRKVAKMFHVDVLDNTLVDAIAWADPLVVGTWQNLPNLELHLMVQDPLSHIEAWRIHVPTVRRVIIHIEVGRPLLRILETLKPLRLETLLAVNPATHVDSLEHYLPLISGVQIMGVVPGKSGQTFLGEPILAKVKRARALFPDLLVALDGGVAPNTISRIANTGVQRCVAASALWKAENPEEALNDLYSRVR